MGGAGMVSALSDVAGEVLPFLAFVLVCVVLGHCRHLHALRDRAALLGAPKSPEVRTWETWTSVEHYDPQGWYPHPRSFPSTTDAFAALFAPPPVWTPPPRPYDWADDPELGEP